MNDKRKKVIISILVLMFLTISGVGYYYWYENKNFVSTEDAKVTGDIVKVSPQISGKILELNMEEGQKVLQGQILGRIELLNQQDGNIEMSILRAPISGVVIKASGTVGEVASVGQVIGMIVDPKKLYITANVEETKIGRIHQNQNVEISIDQMSGQNFSGKVLSLGQASNSTFSLIPSSSGGTFTKVVQKIPVKIALDVQENNLLSGTNAVVKIHIR